MSKPIIKHNAILRSPQVLAAFVAVVRRHLPLDLQHTRITADDLITVLGYASARQTSLDAACHELATAPSANRLREVLTVALGARAAVQRAVNTLLRSQLPRCMTNGKRAYAIALDLTLIPYHGDYSETDHELRRSQAKAGTTHFHGYASVSIVHHHQRYVVALCFVEKEASMQAIVGWLLTRLKTLGIRIQCAYFDKGFCAVPVLKTLKRRKVRFMMPLPVRGQSGGVRKLFGASASYTTRYTFNSPKHGQTTVAAVVVQKYSKQRYRRKGVRWFAYAVAGLASTVPPRQVFELYRQRFGIETSYRQMHQVRARTTSRNPVLRLLWVGLAFVLFNLYIACRQHVALGLKTAARPVAKAWLTLPRLARLLAHAVEGLFGLAEVLVRHAHFALS